MKKLLVFSDCVSVAGVTGSVLCDLSRNKYWRIPLVYHAILANRVIPIEAIFLELSSPEEIQNLQDFVSFLEDEDIAFEVSSEMLDYFPELILNYSWPGIINNGLFAFDCTASYDLFKAIDQFTLLGGRHLQLISSECVELELITQILKHIASSEIRSIEIITKYSLEHSRYNWADLILANIRIKAITFHSASTAEAWNLSSLKGMGNLIHTTQIVNVPPDPRLITLFDFNVNLDRFIEAKEFNTFFNKKVCIDRNGAIKNSLNSLISFGNINESNLENVVCSREFQALWKSTKDNTLVCRSCEYRYICNDSRIPILGDDGIWKHTSNCSYDPFTGKWDNTKT